MTLRSTFLRTLPPWADAIAMLFVFGLVSGTLDALARFAGVPRHWSFAIGWIGGLVTITARYVLFATGFTRSTRLRVFAFHVALIIGATVLGLALWGSRIFVPAA